MIDQLDIGASSGLKEMIKKTTIYISILSIIFLFIFYFLSTILRGRGIEIIYAAFAFLYFFILYIFLKIREEE